MGFSGKIKGFLGRFRVWGNFSIFQFSTEECTHGSGGVVCCGQIQDLSIEDLISQLAQDGTISPFRCCVRTQQDSW